HRYSRSSGNPESRTYYSCPSHNSEQDTRCCYCYHDRPTPINCWASRQPRCLPARQPRELDEDVVRRQELDWKVLMPLQSENFAPSFPIQTSRVVYHHVAQ